MALWTVKPPPPSILHPPSSILHPPSSILHPTSHITYVTTCFPHIIFVTSCRSCRATSSCARRFIARARSSRWCVGPFLRCIFVTFGADAPAELELGRRWRDAGAGAFCGGFYSGFCVMFCAARAEVQHRAAVEHHAQRGARQQLQALGAHGRLVQVHVHAPSQPLYNRGPHASPPPPSSLAVDSSAQLNSESV
jgi:hypothetical protein